MIFQFLAYQRGTGGWSQQMSLRVAAMTEWEIERLHLWNNRRPTLVKQIAHVRFTALIQLYLVCNEIDTVEMLPTVSMPQIQSLQLCRNNIASVGVIRKAAWPGLQILNLNENQFGDGKLLVEGHFRQLETLTVCNVFDGDSFSGQRFPCKMETFSLRSLSINRRKFCFRRTQRVFKRRFPQVQIN